MLKKIGLLLSSFLINIPAFAGAMGEPAHELSPFYVGAYGGYGNISQAYYRDGKFVQGRLALGFHASQTKPFVFGAEVGVQSGTTLRLNANPFLIELAGGLPIQATLKPIADILATVKVPFSAASPIFCLVKGGVAYRQLQLNDRASYQDNITKLNGELQVGLGYSASEHVTINAFYQGIYGSNPGLILDPDFNILINGIPTQQAGFLGVEYTFN